VSGNTHSRTDREDSTFSLEPHRVPANRKAGSSRRNISGLFRFRFTESRLDLIHFYAGRRIARLIQILLFGTVTHHSGVDYLGLLFWDFRDWLVGHAKPPCEKSKE
jgi:hypothetical protein